MTNKELLKWLNWEQEQIWPEFQKEEPKEYKLGYNKWETNELLNEWEEIEEHTLFLENRIKIKNYFDLEEIEKWIKSWKNDITNIKKELKGRHYDN